jgi:SAM-dependent methyltransferase
MKAEFDRFAGDYEMLLSDSIKASGYEPSYFDEQKIREVFRRVGDEFSGAFNFLNFGCGVGKSEKFIRQYFPACKLHGADVSAESLKIATARNKEFADIFYHHFEQVERFDPGVKFDIIFVANVFHHIPEDLHLITLQQLRKLLSGRGKLFIFEHNPLNPLTRHAFNTCEFDHGCKMIPAGKLKKLIRAAGFEKVDLNFTLFFPAKLKFLTPLEKYMTLLPIGAQYYTICS